MSTGGIWVNRCGHCANCKHVERTGRLLCPVPPFTHFTTRDVELWNECLALHPCSNRLSEHSASEVKQGFRVIAGPHKKPGRINYIRCSAESGFETIESASVLLDECRNNPGYAGTVYPANQIFIN